MSTGNEDPFLTVAEVAELLKINQQTVRNWIDAGSLPAVKLGRRVRIKRADLDRIVDGSYTSGQPGSVSTGPSAEDFWGGEPVGSADLAFPAAEASTSTDIDSEVGNDDV